MVDGSMLDRWKEKCVVKLGNMIGGFTLMSEDCVKDGTLSIEAGSFENIQNGVLIRDNMGL